MGLTLHHQLAATADEADARMLVHQLRPAALDLRFERAGEMVEYGTDRYGASNPAGRANSFPGHE